MADENNPRILVISIDISEDVKGKIVVHEHDSPEKISEDFLAEYSLDKSMKAPLVELIKSHQAKFRQKHLKPSRKNSSQTTDIKNSSIVSVAERIMQHSYRYSGSMTKSSSFSNYNYGQVLYEKGKKMKLSQRQNSEKRLQDQAKTLQKELTFKPKISKKSQELSKDVKREEKSSKHKEQMNALQKQKEFETMKECYFVPMISDRSSRNNENRNIFTELYKDACERHKSIDSQKPLLSETLILKRPDEQRLKQIETLTERLSNSKAKTQAELERYRHELEANIDKETGQKFFTPVTGRGPSGSRERPVWEELYSLKDSLRDKLDTRTKEGEKNYTQPSESSCKLFENFKTHKFEDLFKKLDSDNDGKISAEKICIKSIDASVLSVIAPVLEELENLHTQYSVKDFCQKMDIFYSKLTPLDKMVVIKKRAEEKETLNFVPKINERSKLSSYNSHLGGNVYERAAAAMEIRDLKLKKAKELKELREKSKAAS